MVEGGVTFPKHHHGGIRHLTIPAGRFPMPMDLLWDDHLNGDIISRTVAEVTHVGGLLKFYHRVAA